MSERRPGLVPVLRATVERCRREGHLLAWVDVGDLAALLDDSDRVSELEAERDKLREALGRVPEFAKWTQHHSGCRRITDAGECSCGLQEFWGEVSGATWDSVQ